MDSKQSDVYKLSPQEKVSKKKFDNNEKVQDVIGYVPTSWLLT